MDSAGRADHLGVAALESPGGINQKAVAAADPRDNGVDHLEGLGLGVAALRGEIGHLEGIDHGHQRPQRQQPVDAAEDEGTQRLAEPEVGEHQRRIDVGRVVGEDERRPLERGEPLGPLHRDPVAEPEKNPGDRPEKPVEQEFHR